MDGNERSAIRWAIGFIGMGVGVAVTVGVRVAGTSTVCVADAICDCFVVIGVQEMVKHKNAVIDIATHFIFYLESFIGFCRTCF